MQFIHVFLNNGLLVSSLSISSSWAKHSFFVLGIISFIFGIFALIPQKDMFRRRCRSEVCHYTANSRPGQCAWICSLSVGRKGR